MQKNEKWWSSLDVFIITLNLQTVKKLNKWKETLKIINIVLADKHVLNNLKYMKQTMNGSRPQFSETNQGLHYN